VLGLVVFIVVFIRTELAIALVLLSMLLSPEFAVGGAGGLAEKRQLVLPRRTRCPSSSGPAAPRPRSTRSSG
jgi:hypothetical protein